MPGTCVVLTYHVIPEDQRERFARQMDLLLKLARPVSAAREQPLEPGIRHAAVTFDDAFRNFKQTALPELASRKIPVVVFVPTGYIGRKSSWFDYGGANPVGGEVMSVEELKQVISDGLVELGSHCVTHPNLVQLSEPEAEAELRTSRESLESLCGIKVNSVSFPYGSYGERELRLARKAGYAFMFSVAPQPCVSRLRGGLMGRVSVQPSDSPMEFRLKLLGAYRWLAWGSALKRKVRGLAGGGRRGKGQTDG